MPASSSLVSRFVCGCGVIGNIPDFHSGDLCEFESRHPLHKRIVFLFNSRLARLFFIVLCGVLQVVGIYKITNLVNQKAYVGQATNIKVRFKNHRSDAFNPNKPTYDYPLYRAIRKYGLNNFIFEVLEECLVSELNEKEIYYIAYYDTYHNGYNQDEGGLNAIHYNKLSYDLVTQIIETLKTSKESSDEIGKCFGVSGSTVRKINAGESCYRDGESYPIRLPLWASGDIDNFCDVCGDLLSDKNAKRCVKCAQIAQRRAARPEPLELAKMIKESGFAKVGKRFGVSDNAVKNWCKQYNIPHKISALIIWYDQQTAIVSKKHEDSSRSSGQKAVEQINPDTDTIVATYPSVIAAARALGRKTGNRISAACRGEQNLAYGYLWRFASPPSTSTNAA